MNIILAILIGYLLGSIPFALVIGKLFYKTDIRKSGSGNLGGTNAGRVLGKKAGVSVTVLDALKCVLAMFIMHFIDPTCTMYAGWACAVGHCYPLFANFKGGKAVATIMGYLLGLVIFGLTPWYVFVGAAIAFFTILKLTKYVSFSSICCIFTGFLLSLINSSLSVSLSILVLWCFSTYRHRENIKRLKAGTESKVKWI